MNSIIRKKYFDYILSTLEVQYATSNVTYISYHGYRYNGVVWSKEYNAIDGSFTFVFSRDQVARELANERTIRKFVATKRA